MTSNEEVWAFALRAIELATETIPDPMLRLEALAQMSLALKFARSLVPPEPVGTDWS